MSLRNSLPLEIEFALIRILGNSLPPRHARDEMLQHLRFILQHEPDLEGCEKSWILNRIADERLADTCAALIEAAGQRVIRLPFDIDAYAQRFNDLSGVSPRLVSAAALKDAATFEPATFALEWKYRYKSLYAISLNAARNLALSLGRGRAQWTLPWDGACYVTRQAWSGIRQLAQRDVTALHLVVPLTRVTDAQALLQPHFQPVTFTEPQLAFRHDSQDRFDEQLRYGNRNKAEMLVRLGVPGPWHTWRPASWDVQPVRSSPERCRFVQGGWVARLPAGCDPQIDSNDPLRWRSRFAGVAGLCQQLDVRVVAKHNRAGRLLCFDEAALRNPDAAVVRYLQEQAEIAMARPIPSVLDKTGCAPSGDRQDYLSMAPYLHRDAAQQGVELRDGVRTAESTPGTEESRSNDRGTLERMIHDVCATALAGTVVGDSACRDHAASMLRAWFIDPRTRMHPHMRFAQCVPGSRDGGQPWGVVDFRNLWPLLDAVTLLRRAGALSLAEHGEIQSWFAAFLDDITSRAGAQAPNNIAVWHDLVAAAIAAFLGRNGQAAQILSDVPLRMGAQLSPFAVPHLELQRSRPLHYGLFLAQGLVHLAWLGRALGIDLWRYQASQARSVAMLIRFLALNRSLLDDYAADAAAFDDRIAQMAMLVPADAVDYAALAALDLGVPGEQADSFLHDAVHHGSAPFFCLLGMAQRKTRPHIVPSLQS